MFSLLLLFSCISSGEDSAMVITIEPCDVVLTGEVPRTEGPSCRSGKCQIPTGEVILGAADSEQPDECPPHQVEITGFSISETEITVQEWEDCVSEGDCEPQPEWCVEYANAESKDIPVTCIDWYGARQYCKAQGGRLPTEAEWELAARGREGNKWSWLEGNPSCSHANYKFVTAYCEGNIKEVGLHNWPTWFGLQDTSGNVWEWTEDWYDAWAYQKRAKKDPKGPTEDCRSSFYAAAGECNNKVLRGGAWDTTEGTIAPRARSFASPDLRDTNVGFRCVWE